MKLMTLKNETIILWYAYLRDVCSHIFLGKPCNIGQWRKNSPNRQNICFRTTNHQVRVISEQRLIGRVDPESKQFFMTLEPDRSQGTLLPNIQKHLKPGTLILSDERKAYQNIKNLPQNYAHETVNHLQRFISPETGAHTQKIEKMWEISIKNFKKWESLI